MSRLLELAEPARFYRVCELLYEQQRRFDEVLLCYLNDPARRERSFGYVTHILNGTEYSASEKVLLENRVVSVVDELVQVDATWAAALIIDLMPKRVKEILGRLEGMPETQYYLLEGAYKVAAGDCQRSIIAIKDAEAITTLPEVQEKYVELKCIFDPDNVLAFLKSVDQFRDIEILTICRSHGIFEATAFILEKLGEIPEAFDSYLHLVEQHMSKWLRSLDDSNPPENCNNLSEQVGKVVYFLQRNSGIIQAEDRELMWFRLLDVVMQPQKDSLDRSDLKELTSSLLNAMMGYVSPHSILSKVMSDPAYNLSEFKEVRRFIRAMIDTYNFEQTMLITTNNLINCDLSSRLADLKKLANRAVIAPCASCTSCSRPFAAADTREVSLGMGSLLLLFFFKYY